MIKRKFLISDIKHISAIYKIPISFPEKKNFVTYLKNSFSFLESFNLLRKLIKQNKPTHLPSNIKNVFRTDKIEKSLSLKKALSNTSKQYKGYFILPSVFINKN